MAKVNKKRTLKRKTSKARSKRRRNPIKSAIVGKYYLFNNTPFSKMDPIAVGELLRFYPDPADWGMVVHNVWRWMYWKERNQWIKLDPTFNAKSLLNSKFEIYGPFNTPDEGFEYADKVLHWTTKFKY